MGDIWLDNMAGIWMEMAKVLSKTGTSFYGTVTSLINVSTELTVAVINH
jgi:hypothetical protein